MKIIIAGAPKSGTTLAGELICRAMEQKFGAVVYAHERRFLRRAFQNTYLVAKVVNRKEMEKANRLPFDKKIFVFRDPRDRHISHVLYEWRLMRELAENVLPLLEQKEINPGGTDFLQIVRWRPRPTLSHLSEELAVRSVSEELLEVRAMHDLACRSGWWLLDYCELVSGKLSVLEEHLAMEVPAHGESRLTRFVARTETFDNWRHTLTERDVQTYRPLVQQHFDCDDWELASEPIIRPEHFSEYVRGIAYRKWQPLRFR